MSDALAEIGSRVIASTPEEAAYEERAAELSIWTGGRLLVGLSTFGYASLAFAYFYLRSANNENLWRPHRVTAPTALGATIFAIVAASAVIQAFGVRRLRQGLTTDWLVAGWVAVLGGLLAVGVQIFELTRLPFFPGSSAYASCFIGWAAIDIGSILVGTYWIETLLARGMRLRKSLTGTGGPSDPSPVSVRMFRVNLESYTYFSVFFMLVSLLFWVLFYLV